MPDHNGAHTTGQNGEAIGICFVGNYDTEQPPIGMWEQGVKLCAWLCRAFEINPQEIYGHREFANKTCPGNQFDVGKFKQEVEARA
jgi:N-acetyl-anhydromuramyl-L-alanine amidase AmpD